MAEGESRVRTLALSLVPQFIAGPAVDLDDEPAPQVSSETSDRTSART